MPFGGSSNGCFRGFDGVLPLMEGQIDVSGLEDGVYGQEYIAHYLRYEADAVPAQREMFQ